MGENKQAPGNAGAANLCHTCGNPLQQFEGRPVRVCLPCLRKVETPPPHPCDGCGQNNGCGNWRRCRRWTEWALISWHHINLRAAQLQEEKKKDEEADPDA